MIKNTLKIIISILILLFLALYFSQYSNYYDYTSSKKTTLTKDAIERFEQDLKDGKKIDPKNYLIKEKNYNNKASNLGMKTSKILEKLFNKSINIIFNELESAITNN